MTTNGTYPVNNGPTTQRKPLISGLAHVNLTIPVNTLQHAQAFYEGTLGLTPRAVPSAQVHELAWYDIGTSGQQLHISYQKHDQDGISPKSSRHPCFKISSHGALLALQRRIYAHFEHRGGGDEAAPLAADPPGESSGEVNANYPSRFFARDFAGNRLEFSL